MGLGTGREAGRQAAPWGWQRHLLRDHRGLGHGDTDQPGDALGDLSGAEGPQACEGGDRLCRIVELWNCVTNTNTH